MASPAPIQRIGTGNCKEPNRELHASFREHFGSVALIRTDEWAVPKRVTQSSFSGMLNAEYRRTDCSWMFTGSSAAAACRLHNISCRKAKYSRAELAQILRTNAGVALPPGIAQHMADWFEGKVKERRGRKPTGVVDELRILWALSLRGRYLSWLQTRRRQSGLIDHATIEWWQGPPHERASRMAVRRLRLNLSWQHLQNLASRCH